MMGCHEWSRPRSTQDWITPSAPPSIDTVRLEVGVAELDEFQKDDLKLFWRDLDFQKLPLEVRRKLDRYGIKVGVMSSRPPAVFADLMKPRKIEHDQLGEFDRQLFIKGLLKPTSRLIGHTRVSSRQGQSYPVMTSDTFDYFTWKLDHEADVGAQAGRNVRGFFSISTYPKGDGSVRVALIPEIHHGDLQKRYGSTEHGFKYVNSQQVQRLETIRFDVDLRVGETLVVGPTEDLANLGQLFFSTSNRQSAEATSIENTPLEELETSMDQMAELALQAEFENGEEQVEDLVALLEPSKDADPTTMTDEELLRAEVREMLRVKPGEKVELPNFHYDVSVAPPESLHRLLLIRVIQSRRDNLFKEIDEVEPLTNVDRY